MDILNIIEQTERRYKERQKEIEVTKKRIKDGERGLQLDTSDRVSKWVERMKRQPNPTRKFFERTINGNDLFDVNYLGKGLKTAQTVGRIAVRDRSKCLLGYGTGFLVAPNIILTNNHVIDSVEKAQYSQMEFNYQYDMNGYLKPSIYFTIRPDILFLTNEGLDYTLVAIDEFAHDGTLAAQLGYNQLIEDTGKILIGDHVSIIQHPNGEPKQIAVRENQLVDITEAYLHYETDTCRGSSGAPVYNDQWELVGLHHSGVPDRDNGDKILLTNGGVWTTPADNYYIKWIANEGVRISRIIQSIKVAINLNAGELELIRHMFDPLTLNPVNSELENTQEKDYKHTPRINQDDQEISIHIPLVFKDGKVEKDKADTDLKKEKEAYEQTIRFEFSISKGILDHTEPLKVIENKWDAKPHQIFGDLNEAGQEFLSLYEVYIKTRLNPWALSAELEDVKGVYDVTPDLKCRGLEDGIGNGESVADEKEALLGLFHKESNKKTMEDKYSGLKPNWNHGITCFPGAIEYAKIKGTLTGIENSSIVQLDTGFLNHPEIKLVKREKGYDFKDKDPDPSDRDRWFPDLGFVENQGHGTRTASIIIGTDTGLELDENNGVLPMVNFIPYRVADSVVVLHNHSNITKAVVAAINQGYEIITMSMGGIGINSWRQAAKLAYDRGVFWICAAGNEVRILVVWPAAYRGTIAVGATDYKNQPWDATSKGKKVDIYAPGHNVYVPGFAGKDHIYSYGSGTSYATPHVAAAVALWLHHHKAEIKNKYPEPWQRIEAFRLLMEKTATIPEDWDAEKYGHGILNVEKLIKQPLPEPSMLKYAYKESVEEMGEVIPDLTAKEKAFRAWNGKW